MLFLPESDTDGINRLIFLWNGEYCDTKRLGDGFAVVSCDGEVLNPPKNLTVISCGMSAKSTVTASSVREDSFVCCVQREFMSIDGKIIEPSEFCLPTHGFDISTALFAATANLIINGIFFHFRAYDV